jgi:hypothetical protein
MEYARMIAILGAVAGVLVAIVVSILLAPWTGVPVGAGVAAYGYWRYLMRASELAEAWRNNHRVLTHHADRRAFEEARSTARQIIEAWPRVAALVGVSDPSPALARSLWDLAEVLVDRARIREKQLELQQAKLGLPEDVRVRDEVADRLAQVEGVLAEINADVARRMVSISAIAEECQRFIREQEAIARAREAVRNADQALGIIGASGASIDLSDELSSRTRSILTAYRDLTKNLGTDEVAA